MASEVTINPDLKRERSNVQFNPKHMTNFLYGGKNKVKRKHYIENLVLNDHELGNQSHYFLPLDVRYQEIIRREIHIQRRLKLLDLTDPDDINIFKSLAQMDDGSPIVLHDIAFVPPIKYQGTEEQQNKWLPMIDRFQILGSYAQTELGHGSNLQKIETTAVFDPKTQEFVLNTPTVSSTKWWPGCLGKTCNYTLLIAQTYTLGKHVGVQAFIVPVRDLETHLPLQGVTVGSIGPVLNGCASDNGFLQLSNVRIPRENMLMKFSQIKPDGTFVKPPNSKALYSGMMSIRAKLPAVMAQTLSKAATIATRYSLVRRQSELRPGSPEPLILEYQTQKHKVFPVIATSYCFFFVADWLIRRHQEFQEELKQSNFSNMLPLHAASSCLKAYTASLGTEYIEVCRLACGGHGYSMAGGFPLQYHAATANITAEGEATILHLQTARYLMKAVLNVQQGKKLDATLSYLKDEHSSKFVYIGDTDIPALVEAFKHRARRCINKAAERIQKLMSEGHHMYDAFNQSGVFLIKASEAHSEVLVMVAFLSKLKSSGEMCQFLEPLGAIYAINRIIVSSGQFIEDGWMTPSQLDFLMEKLYQLYDKIRPNAIAYVDAFDYRDRLLQSVLGRYDGNVYEEMYKWAQQAPLNETPVHESFHKYVKPFSDAMKSKI